MSCSTGRGLYSRWSQRDSRRVYRGMMKYVMSMTETVETIEFAATRPHGQGKPEKAGETSRPSAVWPVDGPRSRFTISSKWSRSNYRNAEAALAVVRMGQTLRDTAGIFAA